MNRYEKHDSYYGGNNNAIFSIITAVDERKCKYNLTWINLTTFTLIKIWLLCQLKTLLQWAKLNHCCSHIDVIQMWANTLSIAFFSASLSLNSESFWNRSWYDQSRKWTWTPPPKKNHPQACIVSPYNDHGQITDTEIWVIK